MNLTEIEADQKISVQEIVVPKGPMLRPFLMGHDAFLADLIWIRTLGYFADQISTKKNLTYLEDLLNLATDLDPRFEKIYIWAGAAFMYNWGKISEEKIRASTRFLEKGWNAIQNDPKGWKHLPDYWRIPQMIGFNYAIELRDKEKGAPFIEATARIPGSPDIYKTWAATIYKKAGNWQKGSQVLEDMLAIETLQGQMESVQENSLKEQIQIRLKSFYQKLYGEDGAERFKLFEERLKKYFLGWQETMPYMSFYFYLINSQNEPHGVDLADPQGMYASIFPGLSLSSP